MAGALAKLEAKQRQFLWQDCFGIAKQLRQQRRKCRLSNQNSLPECPALPIGALILINGRHPMRRLRFSRDRAPIVNYGGRNEGSAGAVSNVGAVVIASLLASVSALAGLRGCL